MNKKTIILIVALLTISSSTWATNYEKLLKKDPGNVELYCNWIDELLQKGDTASAEDKITYLKKMNSQSPCLSLHQASIAYHKGRSRNAALYYADAINMGYEPEDDSLFNELKQTERMILLTKLEHQQTSTRYPEVVSKAIQELQKNGNEDENENENMREERDSILYHIKYTRTGEKRELNAQVNGLRVKLVVDSTAQEPTINDVELQFLRKNKYIREDEIANNRTHVTIREIRLTDEVVLRDVRVRFVRTQEDPIILSLTAMKNIGRAELDDKKEEIIIYKTKKN